MAFICIDGIIFALNMYGEVYALGCVNIRTCTYTKSNQSIFTMVNCNNESTLTALCKEHYINLLPCSLFKYVS